MRLPTLAFLVPSSADAARLHQQVISTNPNEDELAYSAVLFECALSLANAYLRWAEACVGPNFTALLVKLCTIDAGSKKISPISALNEAQDFLSGFQRAELSFEGLKKRLKDRQDARPDWMKAWDKVIGPWIIPPTLTNEERAHIECFADKCLVILNTPTTEGPPSVFETPPTL